MVPAKKKNTDESFKKRLSECTGNAEALLELGKSCFLTERYEDAIDAYREAIALEIRNEAAFYNLGVAYQALGKYTQAKQAFLKALEINPNHEAAQEALSSLTDY